MRNSLRSHSISSLTKKMLPCIFYISHIPYRNITGLRASAAEFYSEDKPNTKRGDSNFTANRRQRKTDCCTLILRQRTVASRGHGRLTPECGNTLLLVCLCTSMFKREMRALPCVHANQNHKFHFPTRVNNLKPSHHLGQSIICLCL